MLSAVALLPASRTKTNQTRRLQNPPDPLVFADVSNLDIVHEPQPGTFLTFTMLKQPRSQSQNTNFRVHAWIQVHSNV